MKIGIAGPIQTKPLAEFLNGMDLKTAPIGLGGIAVTQLVKGLLCADLEVSVYTLDEYITFPRKLCGDKLTIYYGPYRPCHRMRDFFKQERKRIKDFILMDNPDIVHAHWTYEFALGALASGKTTLITVRDWAPTIFRLKTDPYRFGRLLMACATFFKGSHFVANSPYIQKRMEKYLHKNVPMIPNALNESIFYKKDRSLNLETPIIVSASNYIDKSKNVKSLMLAYQIIKKEIPNCRLILIGNDFGKNGTAEEWAKRNNISNDVEFWGLMPHDDVLKVLESADLMVHPSLEESFGMTLLEAMAKKTPVVGGANSGAVPWVLDGGKAGLLTDVTRPDQIAESIKKILTNQEMWQMFSNAGYQHAWEHFRIPKIVRQYTIAYHSILTGKHKIQITDK